MWFPCDMDGEGTLMPDREVIAGIPLYNNAKPNFDRLIGKLGEDLRQR